MRRVALMALALLVGACLGLALGRVDTPPRYSYEHPFATSHLTSAPLAFIEPDQLAAYAQGVDLKVFHLQNLIDEQAALDPASVPPWLHRWADDMKEER